MFKNPFQIAIVFALLALVVKLTIYLLGAQHGDMERYIFFIYTLILCINVFFGIRSNKLLLKDEGVKAKFGDDFKAGARSASFFALIVALITYIYYAKIDVDFFEIKQSTLVNTFPEKIKNAYTSGSLSKTEIREKIIADVVNGKLFIYTPYFQAILTLFGLVFIGLFYSVLFAFTMRKVPGFK